MRCDKCLNSGTDGTAVLDALRDLGCSFREMPSPYVFLQWKGTDACFDFYCKCGAHCHFDGDFAYNVKCPHCERVYQMPFILFPKEIFESDADARLIQMLNEDETANENQPHT